MYSIILHVTNKYLNALFMFPLLVIYTGKPFPSFLYTLSWYIYIKYGCITIIRKHIGRKRTQVLTSTFSLAVYIHTQTVEADPWAHELICDPEMLQWGILIIPSNQTSHLSDSHGQAQKPAEETGATGKSSLLTLIAELFSFTPLALICRGTSI